MRSIRQYIRNFFNSHQPSDKVRRETYERINLSLNKAFALPSLNNYSQSLSLRGLLIKSVEMFVGSRVVPKNLELSHHLMKIAERKAKTDKERQEIEYYKAFFMRIDAFKNGKQLEFDLSSQMLTKIAENGHPQSCYLAGKQLFNLSMMTTNEKDRKQYVKTAAFYFERSLTDVQFGGLFYLGEIYKRRQFSDVDIEDLREFYVFGAAMGDPLCYFRLSQLYKEEGKKELHQKYLMLAAQSGVIEAQHNLGCEYYEGKSRPKDEVKAMAWFIHAAANGFVESKYNLAYMFMVGSQCGRIKPNRKAALLYLQQLKEAGESVDDKIQQLVEAEEKEKESHANVEH